MQGSQCRPLQPPQGHSNQPGPGPAALSAAAAGAGAVVNAPEGAIAAASAAGVIVHPPQPLLPLQEAGLAPVQELAPAMSHAARRSVLHFGCDTCTHRIIDCLRAALPESNQARCTAATVNSNIACSRKVKY